MAVCLATDEQKQRIHELTMQFGMTPGQVTRRLAAHGASSLDDLTEATAQTILTKLESALANQVRTGQTETEG